MSRCCPKRNQKGFTLVELAIVIMIIGLLIGGVLKGEELIANARVTATAMRVHPYEVALATFRSNYEALPGDMKDAATRLPDCAGDCVLYGGQTYQGNGRLDGGTDSLGYPYNYEVQSENQQFFYHLAAANLIDSVDSRGTDGGSRARGWGVTSPSVPTGGGFNVAQVYRSTGWGASQGQTPGIYLILRLYPHTDNGQWEYMDGGGPNGYGAFTAREAHQFDSKLDDGKPLAGKVRSYVSPGRTGCGDTDTYNDNNPWADEKSCDMRIMIGGK